MKLTSGTKANRTLMFVTGLTDPLAAGQLKPYGFKQAHLDEGRALIESVREIMLCRTRAESRPPLFDRVNTWEDRWLPIAEATLARHYPAVREYVFLNIVRSDGREVFFSVGQVVARIRKLETEEPVPEAKAARALLAERGLTEAVIAEAEHLLDEAFTVAEMPAPAGPSTAEQQAAVDAMWAWYLEWGGIARVAIQNRRTLRSLGFLRTRTKETPDEVTDEEVFGVEARSSVDASEAPVEPKEGGVVAA